MLAGVISVRINAKLGTTLSAVDLFEHRTVESLAASIDPDLAANAGQLAPLQSAMPSAPFTPEERSQVCAPKRHFFTAPGIKDCLLSELIYTAGPLLRSLLQLQSSLASPGWLTIWSLQDCILGYAI